MDKYILQIIEMGEEKLYTTGLIVNHGGVASKTYPLLICEDELD